MVMPNSFRNARTDGPHTHDEFRPAVRVELHLNQFDWIEMFRLQIDSVRDRYLTNVMDASSELEALQIVRIDTEAYGDLADVSADPIAMALQKRIPGFHSLDDQRERLNLDCTPCILINLDHPLQLGQFRLQIDTKTC